MSVSRLLGLDYGKKRIGLALSDPLGMFATGLVTVEGRSEADRLSQVVAVVREHEVGHVVVGLPMRTDGGQGALVPDIRKFIKRLQAEVPVGVSWEDERYTSQVAEQALRAAGKKPSRDKGLVDKTAAALILQQYLDRLSAT
ncbi:MAG: Holliday junction resolvase RuvX [Cyanobacteria bacterium HKST-UBA06]|nr:Holliday junction resolvase RuvX [Cyanobacteria bacterium HKST-UBA06]